MIRNKNKVIFFTAVVVVDLLFLLWLASILNFLPHLNFALLNPKGTIAQQEKNVIITAFLLMLIVVVPVLGAALYVARKYRADNTENTDYQPEWEGDLKLQIVWWVFPTIIIICLSVLTWKSSHAVDPFKAINSPNKPITIEVVALNWKWLFIYPEQNIATVNYVEFPQNVPINFILTSDAPMNSFWIPQLGGQMYAMAGMQTQLHLMANEQGEYDGSAAEINGPGFAGMRFKAKATTVADFQQWIGSVHQSETKLDSETYAKLAQPSTENAQAYYAAVVPNLFDTIMKNYMAPNMNNMQMDTK
ncbi:MAG: cyoA [Candidatus Doudnabacteria bacterium]|nr:cyoA [Candidatus Doudnabacteria bacterium]